MSYLRDEEVVVAELKGHGWVVYHAPYAEILLGPYPSEDEADAALKEELERRNEAAAELQAVVDRDFTPPYEP